MLALPCPEALHLRPLEHDAGLEVVLDEIVVPRPPVLGDDLHGFLVLDHGPPLYPNAPRAVQQPSRGLSAPSRTRAEEPPMPTVLVTSASRGIGREFVRQYAADGWRVIAACRHPGERGPRSCAPSATGCGRSPWTSPTSPRSRRSRARTTGRSTSCSTPPGSSASGADAPGEVNYAEWARVLDVNTMGPVRVLDAFADRLAAAGGAKAITLTSGLGSIGDVGSGGRADVPHLQGGGEHGDARPARSASARAASPSWSSIPAGCAPTWAAPAPRSRPRRASPPCARSIDGLTPEATGSFLNWKGGGYPW